MKRVVLENWQSPGDILMLTAAVRDLVVDFGTRFRVYARTTAHELWENNPYVCQDEPLPNALQLNCEYPLIHTSNSSGLHFSCAFHADIGGKLGIDLQCSQAMGDVHLSASEMDGAGLERYGLRPREDYWLMVAGGKYDFTAKWWPHVYFQEVVDRAGGDVRFVQIGAREHHHPPLDNVVDLRGKTNLRDLVELVYWCRGVVCPVTFMMHLAAAVPANPEWKNSDRGAIVLAGGREPPTWEAYPQHRFLHTIGQYDCCANGGCWRSRVRPLFDGSEQDKSLCFRPHGDYAECMWAISPSEVLRHLVSTLEN